MYFLFFQNFVDAGNKGDGSGSAKITSIHRGNDYKEKVYSWQFQEKYCRKLLPALYNDRDEIVRLIHSESWVKLQSRNTLPLQDLLKENLVECGEHQCLECWARFPRLFSIFCHITSTTGLDSIDQLTRKQLMRLESKSNLFHLGQSKQLDEGVLISLEGERKAPADNEEATLHSDKEGEKIFVSSEYSVPVISFVCFQRYCRENCRPSGCYVLYDSEGEREVALEEIDRARTEGHSFLQIRHGPDEKIEVTENLTNKRKNEESVKMIAIRAVKIVNSGEVFSKMETYMNLVFLDKDMKVIRKHSKLDLPFVKQLGWNRGFFELPRLEEEYKYLVIRLWEHDFDFHIDEFVEFFKFCKEVFVDQIVAGFMPLNVRTVYNTLDGVLFSGDDGDKEKTVNRFKQFGEWLKECQKDDGLDMMIIDLEKLHDLSLDQRSGFYQVVSNNFGKFLLEFFYERPI